MKEGDDLMDLLSRIADNTGEKFIFIIDEWDAICREFTPETSAMDSYLNWLRRMFKSSDGLTVFAGVYMTGILPVKKFRTQSALNNFTEYSVVSPRQMDSFFGFTKDEVRMLAEKHGMSFDELEKWYDGYQIGGQKYMFNPNSVIQAINSKWCESYWGRTGAIDSISDYIHLNYEGLRDDIIFMLAGGRCSVKPSKFQNDLSEIKSRDDVLIVLIHLGYLSYDRVEMECFIPNLEVCEEMENAIEENNWTEVIKALRKSDRLLKDTLAGNEIAVAEGLEEIHDDKAAHLQNRESIAVNFINFRRKLSKKAKIIWSLNKYLVSLHTEWGISSSG